MFNLVKKINAVLTAVERRALRKHLLFGLLISLLDIFFLSVVVWLFNVKPGSGQSTVYGLLPNGFIYTNLSAIILTIVVAFAVKNFVGFRVSRAQYKFNYGVAARISDTRLRQYMQSGYLDFVNTDSSVYQYSIAQQPVEFSQYVLAGLQQMIIQSALITLTIAAILIYKPSLFLLLTGLLVPAASIILLLMKKRVNNIRAGNKANSEKSLQYLRESLSAYVETHMYNSGDFFAKRYGIYQTRLNNGLANLQSVQLLPSGLFEVFAIAGIGLMMLYGQSAGHSIGLVTIGVFTAAVYKIVPGLVKIITHNSQLKAYEHTLTSMVDDVTEQESAPTPPVQPINQISFSDVSFGYDHRQLISDLSFELRQGDFAGISGFSGRGKTTVLNLLLGFLKPDSGSILVNGNVIDNSDITALRERISYVKQSALLIHDTILKNITLSDGDSYDDERLTMALTVSGLDRLLDKFPEGIHKLVAQDGGNLSGGQCQRVMLARALYKDFDLLILDEPFNELDEVAELAILQNLNGLAQSGKIILLITHNGIALCVCNKLIRLDAAVTV